MALRSLPATYMRGGTSRALFFDRADLPLLQGADTAPWDRIFCAAMGSPDPWQRQLDGMGGGITSLSKVAVIGPPTHPEADVDYTFAQVDVTAPVVGYRGNCGNISAAVGPYALHRGLVRAEGDRACVTIHNTNTRKLIRASFPVEAGQLATKGDLALDGVAGNAAPIELAFPDPGGAATGRVFPTGQRQQELEIPGHGAVRATMIDVCNPLLILEAPDFGLVGDESAAGLASDAGLLARLSEARCLAAATMGLVESAEVARKDLRNLPLVAVISRTEEANLRVRMFSSDQPHKASPLTGAMGLAAAAAIPGTLAHEMAQAAIGAGSFRIAHVSGVLEVAAKGEFDVPEPLVTETTVLRTARVLMQGRVFY
ncbi:PrpF domain-containing protein [Paracoccus sp. N5]|uniref:PrpF domain-containing protein n=1 Tax=Paracoccus sp. N5 TaxID=1101189 RepID=UPI00035CDB80|nr:PrpF domain-containing protein [Paracoccus sp. N5]